MGELLLFIVTALLFTAFCIGTFTLLVIAFRILMMVLRDIAEDIKDG